MTDKILELAKRARVSKQTIQSETGKIVYEEFSFNSEQLEAFANLIRADEREQCAKICEVNGALHTGQDCADFIRARGE